MSLDEDIASCPPDSISHVLSSDINPTEELKKFLDKANFFKKSDTTTKKERQRSSRALGTILCGIGWTDYFLLLQDKYGIERIIVENTTWAGDDEKTNINFALSEIKRRGNLYSLKTLGRTWAMGVQWFSHKELMNSYSGISPQSRESFFIGRDINRGIKEFTVMTSPAAFEQKIDWKKNNHLYEYLLSDKPRKHYMVIFFF